MKLPRVFRTSLFVYTLSYLVGVSVAVFVVLALVYGSLTLGFFRELNRLVADETAGIVAQHDAHGVDGVMEVLSERIQLASFPRLFYLLVDADGTKMSGNLARWPERLEPVGSFLGPGNAIRQWIPGAEGYDFVGSDTVFPGGQRLMVAQNYQDIREYLRLTLTVLLQAMVATIVLGSIGAALLALWIERRIATVNRSIDGILRGDLSQRIPVNTADDDFARLIKNFNRMLERIQQLMEGVTQLSDNIAHDLRTPLMRLRNGLSGIELDDLGARRETVAGLIEEADALLATFGALLRIAQIESGNRRAAFQQNDLSTIAADVCEFYEPLAAERGITLETRIARECLGICDRDLLFQALANLIDNAIKYAPEGGCVGLALQCEGPRARFIVSDNGPGIPEAERDKVFQRFYRVEASRSQRPGNGLGLSLVQAVVALHGGEIRLDDNGPGLRVSLGLPR